MGQTIKRIRTEPVAIEEAGMSEKRRARYVRTGGSLVLLVLLTLSAGSCSELPTEIPPQQANGECVWVNGEWVCP